MPSSAALLEADEGEPEVPPLLHAFPSGGLPDPAGPARTPGGPVRTPGPAGDPAGPVRTPGPAGDPRRTGPAGDPGHYPGFGFLGAVLDLKPLGDDEATDAALLAASSGRGAGLQQDGVPAASALLAGARGGRRRHPPVFPGPGPEPGGAEPPPPPETILLYNNNNHHQNHHHQNQHHHHQHHHIQDLQDLQDGDGDEAEDAAGLRAEGCGEAEHSALLLLRRKSVNTTECVAVPSSEHVAEIVGRQGCKIKALRAKTNTYIKTPVRGEQPVFVVTGRKEDVAMAKREILSAAEHFSLIRASRNKAGPLSVVAGPGLPGAPTLPGQTTIQVRVPYRVVGLVVGPKGATIKRIQQQTHTYIVTPSRDKEPVFEVTGMPENVDRAREEIEAHIALRTSTCGGIELPGADDNDFHFNGTDVSFEGLAAGLGHAAWLQSTAAASAAAASGLPVMGIAGGGGGAPQVNGGGGVKMSSTYRNDSSSSLGSGSSSADSFYGNGNLNRMADFSPTCSVNANANNNNNGGGGGGAGASFWFGDAGQPLGSDELVGMGGGGGGGGGCAPSGFDPLTISTGPGSNPLPQPIWSPYTSHPGTPRLSPTFAGTDALEHPQAQRVQRASLGSAGAGAESHVFPGYGPAFSSSSESTASACSSSPPNSSFPYRPAPASAAALPGPAASAAAAAPGRGAEICIHCMESQVVAALVPCGHHLFCLECATQICHGSDAACPVCFYPVTQAIQLRNM
ncbi:unnamed protein product [Merluccius merluccius]